MYIDLVDEFNVGKHSLNGYSYIIDSSSTVIGCDPTLCVKDLALSLYEAGYEKVTVVIFDGDTLSDSSTFYGIDIDENIIYITDIEKMKERRASDDEKAEESKIMQEEALGYISQMPWMIS